MSGELMRRSIGAPVPRGVRREMTGIVNATHVEQANMRAISVVAESAMTEVMFLKRTQHELELLTPDAADALNVIAGTAAMAIARTVARFGNGF